jgi:hypothetical protein
VRELKDYPGYSITETGEVYNSLGEERPVYLSGIPQYKYVSLPTTKNKKGWQIKRVHILVAQTYIPNPENLPMVDHKDRDKMNNHKDNLQWATRSTNNRNTSSAVYVEWCGESIMLVELVNRLYGVQKPHYTYIWKKLDNGVSLEQAISDNNKLREKLGKS